jgi:hypothetical protein
MARASWMLISISSPQLVFEHWLCWLSSQSARPTLKSVNMKMNYAMMGEAKVYTAPPAYIALRGLWQRFAGCLIGLRCWASHPMFPADEKFLFLFFDIAHPALQGTGTPWRPATTAAIARRASNRDRLHAHERCRDGGLSAPAARVAGCGCSGRS